jgi:hypothetical protein
VNVNISALGFSANHEFVRIRPINDEMVEKAEKDGKDGAWPRFLVLTHAEARFAIQCAKGESDFYPWFDDGIHKIRIHPRGLDELYTSGYYDGNGGRYESFYFIMPGEWFAHWLEHALEYAPHKSDERRFEFQVEQRELTLLKSQYGPKYQWAYHPEEVEGKLMADLRDPRQTRLEGCVEQLTQIAKNYSDGKVVTVNIQFDNPPLKDYPMSYYFWIVTASGYRIINGGIIAHRNRQEGEYIDEWQYSTHT